MKKAIIFNDKDNFEGSLKIINNLYGQGKKRFWDIEEYTSFIVEKLSELEGMEEEELKLIKSYIYTGRYNSKLIKSLKWNCNKEIERLNEKIEAEKRLIDQVKSSTDDETFKLIKSHTSIMKEYFESRKKEIQEQISKQKRNFEGQKALFNDLEDSPMVELRTTPLKQANCEVYQKGVDGKIVTDIVRLAHNGSYDVALILSGDTDIVEAINHVRENLSKTVVVVACHDKDNKEGVNVSDMKKKCDYFVNLHDYKDELFERFEPLKKKE